MTTEKLDLEPLDLEPIEQINLESIPEEKNKEVPLTQTLLQSAVSGGTWGLGDIAQAAGITAANKIVGENINPQIESSLKTLDSSLAKIATKMKTLTPESDQYSILKGQFDSIVKSKQDLMKLGDLSQQYYSAKDVVKKAREEAETANPKTALAANLLAGAASGAGAAKLAAKSGSELAKVVLPYMDDLTTATPLGKMGVAVREGVKAGATSGIGTGESQLLEGDVGGTLKEGVLGGTIGGVLGGGIGLTGRVLTAKPTVEAVESFGKSLSKAPVVAGIEEGYKVGRDTGKFLTDQAAQGEYQKNLAEGFYTKLKENLRESSGKKTAVLKEAGMGENPVVISAEEPMSNLRTSIENLKTYTPEEKAQQQKLLDKLTEMQDAEKRALEVNVEKLEKQMLKGKIENPEATITGESTIMKDFDKTRAVGTVTTKKPVFDEEGELLGNTKKVKATIGDPIIAPDSMEFMSPLQAESVLRDLRSTYLTNRNPSEAVKAFRDFTVALKNKIGTGLEEASPEWKSLYDKANSEISGLLTVQDWMGISGKSGSVVNEQKIAEDIQRLVQFGSKSSPVATLYAKNFLEKVNPELAKDFTKVSNSLQSLEDAVRSGDVSVFGGTYRFLNLMSGALSSSAGIAKRAAGEIIKAAKQDISDVGTATHEVAKQLIGSSADTLAELANRAASSASTGVSNFVKPLMEAAKSPERKRAAILYSLQQNPAFKQWFMNEKSLVTEAKEP